MNIKMWTEGLQVEELALQQISNMASLPIIAGHIAIMPDVHYGKGATVGSVIPTRGAIIPAAVGVDIGCGMCAIQTSLRASDLPDSLRIIRSCIEAIIPVGFNMHNEQVILKGNNLVRQNDLQERFNKLEIIKKFAGYTDKVWRQAGTLGGGNHFIELCLDESDSVWVMLHSGSRNIGKQIAESAITMAKEIAISRSYSLPDTDLAWLEDGTKEFHDYKEGLLWAQEYASLNRSIMMKTVLDILEQMFGRDIIGKEQAINCHHNYASIEDHFGEKIWITRKGAVSASEGELGIIPGSMGAKSFIVRGKGNPDSYASCSHGAGRRMSRGQAKRSFTLADLENQTMGVECRKDKDIIDEIPGAYKDIEAVMAAQSDLVEVVHTLKQILCIKG